VAPGRLREVANPGPPPVCQPRGPSAIFSLRDDVTGGFNTSAERERKGMEEGLVAGGGPFSSFRAGPGAVTSGVRPREDANL
jgi:hypothetical protein